MRFLRTALLIFAMQMLWVPASGQASFSVSSQKVQAEKAVSLQELEQGIAERLKRVEEFKFIEQEAAKLGVRAWLFGGTAAGYAHYVKWDMQREKGDPRFQKDRFDYDYTNIYRSTQDLDIVIDGNPEQAEKLQAALQEKYPHLQGSKTAWEVRLLTQDMGDKQAILNNPDFMNQHTDSNSTGLIEITKPHEGESVVRDVRDWKTKEPFFLKDVHEGKLHYYFSPLHESTKFAREGRNPPILSAIRFLTKAFQYELKIRPEDLERIQKVIHEFDPKRDTQNSYVANWVEKNGKKLFQNAVNLEYAWDTLEKLGLRKKLQSIQNDASTIDSLAWWMNKEPLRTGAIGQGSGKTAKELGLDIVAHETDSFLAYESITRAHTGDANVLISRKNAEGEAADHGEGFYTRVGKEGARDTGLTIRFHLDPQAREGADFEYVRGEEYVVVKNKEALKVIPESLNIEPVEFFRMLSHEDSRFAKSDLGIIEKLKRRIRAKANTLSASQIGEISRMVSAEINSGHAVIQKNYDEVALSPLFREALDTVPELIHFDLVRFYELLAGANLRFSDFDSHYLERIRKRLEAQSPRLSKSDHETVFWIVKDEISDLLKSNGQQIRKFSPLLQQWFLSPLSLDHPELVQKLLKSDKANYALVYEVLSQPQWLSRHPEWVDHFLDNPRSAEDRWVIMSILSKPMSKDHPEWVEKLINRGLESPLIVQYVLSQPHWQSHPKWAQWVEQLISKKSPSVDAEIAEHILVDPRSQNHPEWIEDLFKRKYSGAKHMKYAGVTYHADQGDIDAWMSVEWKLHTVLATPHWKNHPGLREIAGGQDPTVAALLKVYKTVGGNYFRTPTGQCVSQRLDQLLK